jgi:hypothetical protein
VEDHSKRRGGYSRSNDSDDAVPEPIGSDGQCNSTTSDWQWEHLTDDDPSTRTPGASEEEDVNADEGNLGPDYVGVSAINGADDGNDEFTDNHAGGTPDKERASSEPLDGPEGDWRGANIDQSGNQGDQEGILD